MRKLALFLLLASLAPAQTTIRGSAKVRGAAHVGASLVSPTPQMGWSSWPGLSCPACYPSGSPFIAPTATTVKAEADNLANASLSGLCAVEYPPTGSGCVSLTGLGYNLVAIDAGWDECVSGSPPCVFQPIASQFPSGISAVATYVHGQSQLLGLYSSPGLVDCINYPSFYQNEAADTALMISWGVDEIRSDWCPSATTIYGSSSAAHQGAFQLIGNALHGAHIGYDVNDAGTFSPSWFQTVGGTRVRIGIDNPGGFWYQKFTGDLSFATPYQKKGYWLDFDVLMGGQKENNQTVTVSDTEARAQFNMHAITASPLIIGSTIESLDSTNLETYSNSEVIAINQDQLGQMGTLRVTNTCGATVCQSWSRLLANGDYAIALVNYDSSASHTVGILWSDFGQSGTFNIRDLWSHSSVGSSSTGYSVSLPAWGSTMLRISR